MQHLHVPVTQQENQLMRVSCRQQVVRRPSKYIRL
jgi:hypothetical protein